MDDTKPSPETKAVTDNWDEAARKSEQAWNTETDETGSVPDQAMEDTMQRTEEGYGSGKDGVDPRKDDDGRTPAHAAR